MNSDTQDASSETAWPFTCDAVVPGLFQGDFPAGDVDWDQFDDVVTMTAEDRPNVSLQIGGLWMLVPIWDGELDDPTGVRAAARTVAERVQAGRQAGSRPLPGRPQSVRCRVGPRPDVHGLWGYRGDRAGPGGARPIRPLQLGLRALALRGGRRAGPEVRRVVRPRSGPDGGVDPRPVDRRRVAFVRPAPSLSGAAVRAPAAR